MSAGWRYAAAAKKGCCLKGMEPYELASLPPLLVGAPTDTLETTTHLALVNSAHTPFIFSDWIRTDDLAAAGLEKA